MSATYDEKMNDYLIEYKVLYGDRKIKTDNFTYHSYLNDFGEDEKKFIKQKIKSYKKETITAITTII